MQLVIDIPENTYIQIQALARNNYFEHDICGNSMRRIANGTPLPRGHGRLIDVDAINLKDISPVNGFSVYGATAEDIDLTPTVLEAESEET